MRWPKNLTILAAALLLAVPFVMPASAASLKPDLPDPAQSARDEADLFAVEGQITSIGDRLKQLDSQKAEAAKQRAEIQQRISKVTASMRALYPKMAAAHADYVHKRVALKDAIANDYQGQAPSAVMMLAESGSVTETLSRTKYRNIVTDHVEELAQQSEDARAKLQEQKGELDSQKAEAESLQKQLDQISQSVAQQEAENKELLANSTNEAAYLDAQIKKSKAAEDALLDAAGGNALWGVFTEGAQVKQGEVIGYEGSTGFSTGCHTHFSVIKDGQWHNPELFWSVLRRPDGKLIQQYGMTEWAKRGVYGGHIHNGIDVVQGCGHAVHAAADGTVVRDNRTDGSGFGHYIMIRHKDGLMTLYGHLI